MMANNTKVFKVVDFPRRLSRSGVSPDIERLAPAGETPALQSRSQKTTGFWCKIFLIKLFGEKNETQPTKQ
jgi:hypothetical protein